MSLIVIQSYSPILFINFTLIKILFAAMWQWHTCQADDGVQCQPGLQSEFQDSQSYTAIINNVAMNIVEHISYYKLEHLLGICTGEVLLDLPLVLYLPIC